MNPLIDPTRDELPEETALRRLLDRTLADVEPADRLEAIRERTRPTAPVIRLRTWTWGALGAAVATAAVIGGFAVLGADGERAADPGPADTPSAGDTAPTPRVDDEQTPNAPPSDTESASPGTTPGTAPGAIAAYYLGDTPKGPRLFREFRPVPEPDDGLADSVAVLTTTPLDPDYRTPWPAGAFGGATFDGEVISVELADASLRDRPAGMDAPTARLAIEQVIYTLQAAVQSRAPVQFRFGDNPIDQVLGVPTSEPLAQGDALDVLSLMSITTPEENAGVSDTFTASGVTNSFEATVDWEVRDGNRVVASGFGTATGAYEPRLFPWTAEVDLSSVPPGTYTFVARTADPSGGAEGFGPDVDTKTITVE